MREVRATMTEWKGISSRRFHVVLLIIGAAFLLTGAFHNSLWFDESYSVAIVAHSFSEIWSIGAYDVHPVLYYWALHLLYLVFGTNLAVYRVFTVCGIIALASLGLTHIRKDMDWLSGLLFSFLVLFMPYLSYMSIQIRMYSWAMFAVMLTWVCAVRIARSKSAKPRQWITFALASVCSAYLHYYALLTVFIINLALLIFLIVKRSSRKRDLVWFICQAACEVLLFMPWLLVLVNQLGVVSDSYWLHFYFPGTIYELLRYPIMTMQLTYSMMGNYGPFVETISYLLVGLALLLLAYFIIWLVMAKRRQHRNRSVDKTSKPNLWHRLWRYIKRKDNVAAFLGLGTYLALLIVVSIASVAMNTMMVYFRYLAIALGPLIYFLAWLLSHIDDRFIVCSACTLLLATSIEAQVLMINDDYSSLNSAPFEYIEENLQDGDALVSSDIGFEGQTALRFPDVKQYYLNWQKDSSWGRAYDAYSPPLTDVRRWQEVLDENRDRVWVLGTSSDSVPPTGLQDILKNHHITNEGDYTMVKYETFYRPYERVYYTVVLMEKTTADE